MLITIPVSILEWRDGLAVVEVNDGAVLHVHHLTEVEATPAESPAWSHSAETTVQVKTGVNYKAWTNVRDVYAVIYGDSLVRVDDRLDMGFVRQLDYQIGQEAIRLAKEAREV